MIGTEAEISWRYRNKHRTLVSFIKTVPASEMPTFFFFLFFFKPLTSCFGGDLEPSQDNPNDIIRGWSKLSPEPLKTLHNCLCRTAHYNKTLDDMFGSIFSFVHPEFDIFCCVWQQCWRKSTLNVGELWHLTVDLHCWIRLCRHDFHFASLQLIIHQLNSSCLWFCRSRL